MTSYDDYDVTVYTGMKNVPDMTRRHRRQDLVRPSL